VSVPGRATPVAESLSDVEERLRPFVTETLCEERKKSKVVLIVAHGNTIRVLVKMLLGLPSSASLAFDVPTGTPIPVDDDLAERLRITGQPGPGN
jgi:2,3-bisphosphoglycerate-dependent phosphoglycerate mutase